MKRCILKAKNISKTYDSNEPITVLKGIHLELEEGTSLAIMGRSGEGKSTLLHILGTLESPTEGEIYFNEKPVDKSDVSKFRNENLGFVFQNFNLLEDYTVLENLLLPGKIARKDIRENSPYYCRALELLEVVGLLERRNFLAKLLSGGEKQRLAIARALVNEPSLIFADEPSGNVDSQQAEKIHELLLGCVKKYNKTLVVVTHDKALAGLCDKTLYLKEGVLKEEDL